MTPPMLLRALLALLCVLAAAAQIPRPCAGVDENCSGSFTRPCCPGNFLACTSSGTCQYVRGQGRG
jgi:hypothetical protein